ncbi:hypothetical protein BDZ94DRAFT_1277367 [Collybia nuda]|uniref:Uncharacterized protein n=1 Tax=Collybia nuda TaxID=64659 RepID=A0A9P6C827_9AGAR|nr:hypothetical protein BDZ94DRAFT_1277367 [Collybia nuda]
MIPSPSPFQQMILTDYVGLHFKCIQKHTLFVSESQKIRLGSTNMHSSTLFKSLDTQVSCANFFRVSSIILQMFDSRGHAQCFLNCGSGLSIM